MYAIRSYYDLGETCYYGAPVLADGALFVPTAAGALWKIDANNGTVIWRTVRNNFV